MTKFQTAQERPARIPHDFDPSVIVQLHDDPNTDATELIACSAGSPEDILIALEELEQDLTLECIENQIRAQNNTGRHYFDQIAPTTTNLSFMDRYTKVCIHKPSRWKACLKPTREQ